jgi:hypothetical protein
MENSVVNGINVSFPSQNVTNLFGGSALFGGNNSQNTQKVEVQRDGSDVPLEDVPEPTTILSAAIAVGWGAWLKRKNSSQQNKTNS